MPKEKPKKRTTGQKILLERYAPIIAKISSLKERDQYLCECNDDYTRFILERLKNEKDTDGSLYEIHHIIPRACGGPDEFWNVVRLSHSDHFLAHKVRYRVYGEENDRLVLRLRSFVSEKDRKAFLQKSLESRRAMKVGMHDPAVQAKSGKKGGSKWTQAKRDALENRLSEGFLAARAAGMRWVHKDGTTCDIQPHEVKIPQDLVERLHAVHPYPEGTNLKSVPGALLKVLKGERQTNHGWRVEIAWK